MGIYQTIRKAFGGRRSATSIVTEVKTPSYSEFHSAIMAEMAITTGRAPNTNIGRIGLISTNPVAFLCVRKIAWGVGSVKWLVDGKDSGEIAKRLNNPCAASDRFSVWQLVAASLAATGNAYLCKSDRASKRHDLGPSAIYFMRPDYVTIRLDPTTNDLLGYEYTPQQGKMKFYEPSEICHIRHAWLTEDHEGVGITAPAFDSFALWAGLTTLRRKIVENSGGVPMALVFSGETALSADQRTEMQEHLDRFKLDGDKFGTIMMIDAGMFKGTVSKIELAGDISRLSPAEMSTDNERMIANMFGVPRLLLGVGGDATYANQTEARRYFWLDTLIPGYLEPIASALSQWLGVEVTADIDNVPALVDFRHSLVTMLKQADWLTVNEKREMMGYSKKPGGDEVLQPAGMIPIAPAEAPPDDGLPLGDDEFSDDAAALADQSGAADPDDEFAPGSDPSFDDVELDRTAA